MNDMQGRPPVDVPEPGRDWGAILFGVVLVAAGGYLLLRDTLKLNVPDISWDMAWPLIVIGIGVVVLLRAMNGENRRRRRLH